MSNRTIVEFNHDYAHQIEGDPMGFLAALLEMLRRGNSDRCRLPSYGVQMMPTAHHSDKRRVVIGSYLDREFG